MTDQILLRAPSGRFEKPYKMVRVRFCQCGHSEWSHNPGCQGYAVDPQYAGYQLDMWGETTPVHCDCRFFREEYTHA